MNDDFNDNIIDGAKWRVVKPTTHATIQEAKSRLEVVMPLGSPAGTRWGLKTLPKNINDFDVKIDVSPDTGVRLVTFLIGKDNPEPNNPASWFYPHYRIVYTGNYWGGILQVRRVNTLNQGTTLWEGVIGYQSSVRFRIRILNGVITLFLGDDTLLATEDCSWLLTAIGNMGVVEFTAETEGLEALCIFDNYVEKAASQPEPTSYNLTILPSLNGTVIPSGSRSYPANWLVSLHATPDQGGSLQNWLINNVAQAPTNPLILQMTASATVEAVFTAPVLATIQGFIRDARTAVNLVGAAVTLDSLSDVTNSDGFYQFLDVAAQVYTLSVSMADYQTQQRTIDASLGGVFDADILLQPVAVPCPADAAYLPNLLHPDLMALRTFRDHCLPRRLVQAYYRYSVLLTPLIIERETRKFMVRATLKTLVKIIRKGGECDSTHQITY